MTTSEIQTILRSAFNKIEVNPFIDTNDENVVLVEIDLLGDDDPVRFAVYTDEVKTKDDMLQNLVEAMQDFEIYENGESYPQEAGYYPNAFSDEAIDREAVTAEYMPVSKESAQYLFKLGKKLSN